MEQNQFVPHQWSGTIASSNSNTLSVSLTIVATMSSPEDIRINLENHLNLQSLVRSYMQEC